MLEVLTPRTALLGYIPRAFLHNQLLQFYIPQCQQRGYEGGEAPYPFSIPTLCSSRRPSVTINSLVLRPNASLPPPFRYGRFLSASVTQSSNLFDRTSFPKFDKSGSIAAQMSCGRNTGWTGGNICHVMEEPSTTLTI